MSTVLEAGNLPAVTPNHRALDTALERDYARLRAALGHAIADEKAFLADVFVPSRPGVKPPSPAEAMTQYTIYRQRYQTLQQAMETHIAKLRVSLRAALTAQTPARARLAMVDAIVERSLSLQERRLFAAIPGLLEPHFKRLRETAEPATEEAPVQAASARAGQTETETTAPSPVAPLPKRAVPLINSRLAPRASRPMTPPVPGWLATFRKDMRSVLLAELDIRLQPIEGLLAALHDR